MKKFFSWKRSKKGFVSFGTALGLAFAVFDPAVNKPESKQMLQFEENTDDDCTDEKNVPVDINDPTLYNNKNSTS